MPTMIELAIYDKLNTASLIDVIPQRYTPTYLEELRGPGGGSFTISKSDPQLLANPGLLEYRNVVRVVVDGVLRGAWIITKKSEVLVGQGELADQAYQVSGPGLRAWGSDSVVYPLEPLGRLTKTARTFSFASPRGSWYDSTAWVAPIQMARQDSQRLLLATFVANAVVPAADDSTAPATAPDGKAKRVGGFVITGSTTASTISTDSVTIGGYQLYGTVASPSGWWWDAAGFHPVQVLTNAPATDPVTGATRYPTLVGPGYVAYAIVDPITGVWDSSTSDTLLDQARHRWYDGASFQTTTNAAISLTEPAPPGWTEVNPWVYGPKDWPTGFAPHARWIWSQESRGASPAPAGDVYFRREFTLAAAGRFALAISADNAFTAYMDGEPVVDSQDVNSSSQTSKVDIDLIAGAHILAIKVTNWDVSTAGLLAALLTYGSATSPTPSSALFVTDTTTSLGGQWLCDPYPTTPPGWTPGEVLLTLLAEAQVRGVSTALNLIPTFTTTADSYGNAWDRNVDWSFGLGTEYSDVISKIEEIKADFFFEPQSDGTVKLHAYTSRGINRSIQVPVINDTFTRTVSNAWGTSDSGHTWVAAGGVASDYNVAAGTGSSLTAANGTSRTMAIPVNSLDTDLYASVGLPVAVTGTFGLIAWVCARSDGSVNSNAYCLRIDFTNTGNYQAQLRKVVAGVETGLGVFVPSLSYTAGTFIRCRIQVVGTTVQAKTWLAGTLEPSAWMLTVDDTSLSTGSNFSLRSTGITGNTSSDKRILWDDVVCSEVPNDFIARQPVVFRPGHNVTSATEDNEFTLVKNALLTSSNDGWFAPTDAVSTLNYGRVEGFLNVPGTQAMATQVATATLTKLGLSQDATTVGFEPFDDHTPWVNFGVGDLVQAPTSAAYGAGGGLTPRRIMSLSLSEDQDTSRVLYAAEFGTINRDRQERIERWLTSIGTGTLGGSVANATSNSGTTGSAPVSYPATGIPGRDPVVVNPVLIGQVISGANIMPGSIMASDKMVANSITANSAIIANAAISSAQIDSLSANKISAGTIMAEIALAGRVATSLTGARAEMNASGFHAFNTLGQEVFTADNVGNVFIQGALTTGKAPEPRIEIADNDLVVGGFSNGIAPRVAFYTGAGDELVPGYMVARDDRNIGGNFLSLQLESPVAYSISAAGSDALFSHQLGFVYISLLGEVDNSDAAAGIVLGARPHNVTGNGKWPYCELVVDSNMYSIFLSSENEISNFPPILVGDPDGVAGPNLAIAGTGIFTRDASGSSPLRLQYGATAGNITNGVRINDGGLGTGSLATATSARHPLQIGSTTSFNMRLDNSSINCINNGAFSTSGLFLNSDGGTVGGPVTMSLAGQTTSVLGLLNVGNVSSANVNVNFNQVWALNNGAAATLFLNFSSSSAVQVGNGTAAGADLVCVAMRPVKNTFAGPGGAITSTAAGGVSSNALGTTYTNIPTSGCIRIDYSARMSIVTGASAQRAFVGVQVQAGSSAGAVVYASTDIEMCEVGVGASITGNEGVSTVGKSIVVPPGILTPGATYFIVITNRVTSATATVTSSNASITVTPMP